MQVLRPLISVAAALTAAVAAAPAAAAPIAPVGSKIAQGVSIAGVPVAGLTEWQARDAVNKAYMADVPLRLGKHSFKVKASRLGLHLYLATPLRAAFAVGRTTGAAPRDFPMTMRFAGPGLRSYVDYLAKTFNREPVSAKLQFNGLQPKAIADVWGRQINRSAMAGALAAAAKNPARTVTPLSWKAVKPALTVARLPLGIVINRETHSLTVYQRGREWHRFGVAVGQPAYPTPSGSFQIVNMQRYPWWYPPDSSWAAGSKLIPPGPGNPLGTRWMGIGGAVGIHGTPDAGSIGYSASHGCIRMQIPDAEWLFERVSLGTPVWIV